MDKARILKFLRRHLRKIVFSITIIVHICALLFISFSTQKAQVREDTSIFKVVDIQEYIPPPPEPEKKEENAVEITKQDTVADEIIETDKEVKEVDIDYIPQHKISEIPRIPLNEIKSKIVYPPLASRQGIEGIVYLQLYIDQRGEVKKVDILKDPGYGFGEAAKNATIGVFCSPAKSNGVPVAVIFRYAVRFTLN